MSGAQTYAGPNVLFDPMLAGRMQSQQNQLMQQQQELTDHDVAMTGQAAAPLLNMSEEDAAAAYPGWLQDMQRQGLAKYAPPTYPGHAATQALVQRAIPLVQQYNLGIMVPPGLATALQGNQPPAQGGQPPAQGGAAGGGQGAGDINSLPKAQFLQAVALRESGGDPAALNYVAKADPTAYARGATASGKYQMVNSTWQQAAAWAGVDTSKYPTAMSAPESVQDQVASALYDHQGTSPWQKGPKDWIKDEGGRYQLATVRPPPGAPGGAPSTQPPGATVATAQPATAPPGTAPQDGRYQVASNAPVAPPASTAPSGAPQFTYPNGKVGGAPDPTGLVRYNDGTAGTPPAGTPVPVAAAPPGPPAAPAAPVVAQGSQPPAPAPTQPAQPQANLPHASEVPHGQNSPQYQEAQRIQQQISQLMPYAALPAAKAKIAQLQAQQQLLMQTDNVVQTQEGQLHVLTGALDKPVGNYQETSPGSGVWVGGPGTEPRFQPPGRLVVTPGGDVYQTTSGGAVLLKHTDPQAVAALKEAEASGTATGTATAKQLPDLMAQARDAAAQEGQIDYATRQIQEAAKGGIPSGYFSQGLATAAAAAKSLGLDKELQSLGINPEAVGNVQTAQKTLAVVGGAILRQTLGPGSAITDAKVEQFIHTQPGIETDPQALQRIMAWARSQYTYTRELGQAAVTEAAKPENAGRLPPHWLPAYYRDHGFAPIFDPGTGEMQQPDGKQPARQTPPPETTPPTKIIQYDAKGKRVPQ